MTDMTYVEFDDLMMERYVTNKPDTIERDIKADFLSTLSNVSATLSTDSVASFFGRRKLDGERIRYTTALKLTEDILEDRFWLAHPHLDAEFYFPESCDETGAEQYPGDPGYITEGFGMSYGTELNGEPARFYCLMSDDVFVKYLWLIRNNYVYNRHIRGESEYIKIETSEEEIARYDTAIQKYCEEKGVVLDDTGFDYFDVENNCKIVYVKGNKELLNPFRDNDFMMTLAKKKEEME